MLLLLLRGNRTQRKRKQLASLRGDDDDDEDRKEKENVWVGNSSKFCFVCLCATFTSDHLTYILRCVSTRTRTEQGQQQSVGNNSWFNGALPRTQHLYVI